MVSVSFIWGKSSDPFRGLEQIVRTPELHLHLVLYLKKKQNEEINPTGHTPGDVYAGISTVQTWQPLEQQKNHILQELAEKNRIKCLRCGYCGMSRVFCVF